MMDNDRTVKLHVRTAFDLLEQGFFAHGATAGKRAVVSQCGRVAAETADRWLAGPDVRISDQPCAALWTRFRAETALDL